MYLYICMYINIHIYKCTYIRIYNDCCKRSVNCFKDMVYFIKLLAQTQIYILERVCKQRLLMNHGCSCVELR